jgi:hypothetical protein
VDGDRLVRKVTYVIAAVLTALVCLPGDAFADGMTVKRQSRKAVVHSACTHEGCIVRRPACPDPYSCSSLYGAYGPYGGAAYWSRYTYAGWYR